jgi:hypothetical protein
VIIIYIIDREPSPPWAFGPAHLIPYYFLGIAVLEVHDVRPCGTLLVRRMGAAAFGGAEREAS